MRPTLQLFALLLTPLLSSAQNFVPSTGLGNFPACAANCAVLQQAQSTCLAQTGQQSSSLAAENCFCQSPTLQALYTTPDAVCVAECPTQQPDRVNLRTWFTSFCSQVGQGVDPNAPTTSTTIVTSTSTNTNGPTSTSGSTSSGQQQSNNKDESWFAGHWQWIVMVIVLAIGLGALAWLLIFLRNRHRRKLDERRAQIGGFPTEREKARGAQSATPDLWGPHQHMAASQGWDYHEDPTAIGAGGRLERRSRSQRPEAGERRHSSHRRAAHKPGSKTRHAVNEVDEQRSSSAKRHHSSKRRSKADPDAIEVHRDPSASQNRKGRSRGGKYDFDRDVEGQ